MLKAVANYTRGDEKKHSVRFEEDPDASSVSGKPGGDDVPIEKLLGTIYVSKMSGMSDAKRLRVTIEEV